jgi:hypothetical protein
MIISHVQTYLILFVLSLSSISPTQVFDESLILLSCSFHNVSSHVMYGSLARKRKFARFGYDCVGGHFRGASGHFQLPLGPTFGHTPSPSRARPTAVTVKDTPELPWNSCRQNCRHRKSFRPTVLNHFPAFCPTFSFYLPIFLSFFISLNAPFLFGRLQKFVFLLIKLVGVQISFGMPWQNIK